MAIAAVNTEIVNVVQASIRADINFLSAVNSIVQAAADAKLTEQLKRSLVMNVVEFSCRYIDQNLAFALDNYFRAYKAISEATERLRTPSVISMIEDQPGHHHSAANLLDSLDRVCARLKQFAQTENLECRNNQYFYRLGQLFKVCGLKAPPTEHAKRIWANIDRILVYADPKLASAFRELNTEQRGYGATSLLRSGWRQGLKFLPHLSEGQLRPLPRNSALASGLNR